MAGGHRMAREEEPGVNGGMSLDPGPELGRERGGDAGRGVGLGREAVHGLVLEARQGGQDLGRGEEEDGEETGGHGRHT